MCGGSGDGSSGCGGGQMTLGCSVSLVVEEGLQAVLRARPDQKNKKRWWCFDCVQQEVDVRCVCLRM